LWQWAVLLFAPTPPATTATVFARAAARRGPALRTVLHVRVDDETDCFVPGGNGSLQYGTAARCAAAHFFALFADVGVKTACVVVAAEIIIQFNFLIIVDLVLALRTVLLVRTLAFVRFARTSYFRPRIGTPPAAAATSAPRSAALAF
jgi:hypothetical protein